MAATTNWSDIVPNFDSMPDAMQQWLTTNLPTFISQAIQDGLQQGFDQHWGVAATGNSYHLVGTDHTHAVMGDHNEVVGGQTTRTRQDSVMTHNLADEIKVTEGAHSHQVNSDTFYLTLGTENRTIASHHATEVGGDHSLVVSGNSAAVAATHTVITGSGNTDDSVVTHSETITGSRYEAVSGTHYIQSGVVVRSVGGPLPTNFTAPTLPPPPSKSNPNGLSDGALAHPGLAQELAPAAPAAAMQSSSQQTTTQTSSAQQQQQASAQSPTFSQQVATQNSSTQQQQLAVAQKQSSGDTKQTKTDLNQTNMGWQSTTGGAAGIVTAGLALSKPSDQMKFVESTNYKGSIQDNIEGDKVTTVEGKLTDSFLGGADSFTKGSASDTVLGMAGDTIIGMSSDALIGLAMPFTLISMGQVLLNMDEDVCVVESKSFKLDIAGMKITTPGGAVVGAKAATEAEKAADLVKAAKKAEEVAQKAKAATEAAKAFLKTSEDVEKLAAKLPDIKMLEKTAVDAKKAWGEAVEARKLAYAGKDSEKLAKATEDLSIAYKATQKADEALADGKKLESATNKLIEAAIKDGGTNLSKDAQKSYEAFKSKDFIEAGESAKDAEQAAKDAQQAAKTMAEVEKYGAPGLKNLMKVGDFFKAGGDFVKAGFSVTKDSKALGSTMKTLLKGFDYAAALKAVGVDADKAAAIVKLTKVSYKSITKGVSAGNRGQAGQYQSDNLKKDPDTKQVDGTEKK